MPGDPFQPIGPRTLRDSVTDTIRRAVLNGAVLPGEQLNQAQIAEKLGVSRGPVREALRQLEEEGLIRSIPYKGTFVPEINPGYVEELYAIRRVLEGFALRRAMELADPQELAVLSRLVASMKEAADGGDPLRLVELDLEFHDAICRCAHHTLLMQMWKTIRAGVMRCLALRHRIYSSLTDIVGTHPDILAAIQSGDVDYASHLLDTHIKDAGEMLFNLWCDDAVEPPRHRAVEAAQ